MFEQPGAEAAFAKEIALGRVGQPQDFARAIIALYAMNFVTGVNLPVSGGMHLTRAPRLDEIGA